MDNLQPGQMLDHYRIIGQLGKGGMATVYKAYQELAEGSEFIALSAGGAPHLPLDEIETSRG